PATSCILQDRLGLPKECLAFDVSLGCSGWVYGMNSVASLISNGSVKKALLLCGDLASRTQSYRDKTAYPLFGDAGTCTAMEYQDGVKGIKIHLATDGDGYRAIIIPDGGYRNPTTKESLDFKDYGGG
ncbi:MAG: ketoacyl-ACP synthase III, partial [Bacteroidia bacterium]|nr:ketoacyl-ACP synthase III [Bacteroidia bacterium]